MTTQKIKKIDNKINSFTEWIGSFPSLIIHTLIFFSCFATGVIWSHWETVLLVLTTLVSLEAIYLSIFIQMSINRNTESLQGVEKDIDEIQEDIGEIAEDVEDMQEEDEEEENEEEQDRRLLKDIQDNLMKINLDLQHFKTNK